MFFFHKLFALFAINRTQCIRLCYFYAYVDRACKVGSKFLPLIAKYKGNYLKLQLFFSDLRHEPKLVLLLFPYHILSDPSSTFTLSFRTLSWLSLSF